MIILDAATIAMLQSAWPVDDAMQANVQQAETSYLGQIGASGQDKD